MTAYRINTENTGLDTDEKALRMVEILADQGYDVLFTRDYGHINAGVECPVEGDVWQAALLKADAEA